jgi:glutaredoxin
MNADRTRKIPINEKGIREVIKQVPLVLFGLSYCPWCDRADEMLAAYNPKKIEIDLLPHGRALLTRKALMKISGMTTFPQIFLKGKLLGGFTETRKKIQRSRRIRKQLENLVN